MLSIWTNPLELPTLASYVLFVSVVILSGAKDLGGGRCVKHLLRKDFVPALPPDPSLRSG